MQLPWAIDEPEENRLSQLTTKALTLLSQSKQGFVLLVEGSLIDWAGHSNDIAVAMGEMDEFANTIEVAEQFVRQHPDTLMVVTADHNTGGLSIGRDGHYGWHPSVLHQMTASPDTIAAKAIATDDWQAIVAKGLGFTPTAPQYQRLTTARMQGQDTLADALKHLIDKKSNTGWTTSGHTGIDVQVFAAGPAAELFNGHQDNTDIANKLISLLPAEKSHKQFSPMTLAKQAAL